MSVVKVRAVSTIAPYTACTITGFTAADDDDATMFTNELSHCQKNKIPFPVARGINL
jgi:hypothetical protein